MDKGKRKETAPLSASPPFLASPPLSASPPLLTSPAPPSSSSSSDDAACSGSHSRRGSLTGSFSRYKKDVLHFDGVNRQGRSASLVHDEEGHVMYPGLVPPEVEAPPGGGAERRGNGKTEDGSTANRNSEAGSPFPDVEPAGFLHASHSTHSLPAEEPTPDPEMQPGRRGRAAEDDGEASDMAAYDEPRSRRQPSLESLQRVFRQHHRQRSSTLPLPGRRRPSRLSDVTLLQELRRTASRHWKEGAYGDDSDKQQQHPPKPLLQHRHTSNLHGTGIEANKSGAKKKAGGEIWHSPDFIRSHRRDGRLPISLRDTSHKGYLTKAVGAAVRSITSTGEALACEVLQDPTGVSGLHSPTSTSASSTPPTPFERALHQQHRLPCPRLNIVIMVIGSRGDAQPFLKLGKVLKEQFGHRVRIATHPAFRDFIEKDAGLEFFSVGGDPAELMAFMVKNPGMIPSLATVKAGDIGRRRDSMAEMFQGFWHACVDATDDPTDVRNIKLVGDKEPFVADAIIANPPSFAHIHCAEALGIPLHLMFTFPYTPTQAFPHPLAVIKTSTLDAGHTNFISYLLVDTMIWQGLGDLVNDFRVKTLGLDPVSRIWAPGSTYRMHVPFTYLWSPGLVPKPADWGPEIDLAGFVFLEMAASFHPPPPLLDFMAASAADPEHPLVYIGFGSIVVDDPEHFTDMIFEAVRRAGVRALVSKGWGGFGGDGSNVPDSVFLLGNTPHDWLFPQVRACVIHGGAGTTAMALKCGLPTMVVPFFGDQYFWGSMIGRSGAGPTPVPYKRLDAENLAEGIRYCLTDTARTAATQLAASIAREGDGAINACRSFESTLALHGQRSMRCAVFPQRVAVWEAKKTGVRLSALAADALVSKGQLSYQKLRLLRHTEWNDFEGPGEPVTAMFSSLARSVQSIFAGVTVVPFQAIKEQRRRHRERAEAEAEAEAEAGAAATAPSTAMATAAPSKAHDGEVFAASIGLGLGRSVISLALLPINLLFAVGQGFHNAPRLYGDDTVRRPPRVSGIRSGAKAAARELVYGVYDGVTGIVRLPVRGAQASGFEGFVKGVGMGLTGFVLKDIAALIGPLAYLCKGLAKQAERRIHQPGRYLRRARMVQGQREMRGLSDDKARQACMQAAVAGWQTLQKLHDLAGGGSGETGGRPDTSKAGHRSHQVTVARHRALAVALESADLAGVALAGMEQGQSLESVVGHAWQLDYSNGRGADGRPSASVDSQKLKKEEREVQEVHPKKEEQWKQQPPPPPPHHDNASGSSSQATTIQPPPESRGSR